MDSMMAFHATSPLEYDYEYFPEEMAAPTPTPLVYIPTMQPIIYQSGKPYSGQMPSEQGYGLSYGGYGVERVSADPWYQLDAAACGHAIPILGVSPSLDNLQAGPSSPSPIIVPGARYVPRSPHSFESPESTPSPSSIIEPLPSPLLSTTYAPFNHSTYSPIQQPQSPIDEMETLILQDDRPTAGGRKRRSDQLGLVDDIEPVPVPTYVDRLYPLDDDSMHIRKRRRIRRSLRDPRLMFPLQDEHPVESTFSHWDDRISSQRRRAWFHDPDVMMVG
ncbi:hypothetical protein FRC02_009987 [Tulasnella sp. 418]|nr:hypothetical protein FRC02_009987 [Tulasnella sp. 418]